MALLDDTEIDQRLQDSEWTRDGNAIAREFTCPDFKAAIAFINRVADVAEDLQHHPDILLHDWNKLRLASSTHSEGGLTDLDFQLAGRIDALS